MFDTLDIRIIAVSLGLLIVLVGEIGFLVARRRATNQDDAPFGVVQGAALALVGLLLGFSFSLALSRYDERRGVLVREANAIETTLLRSDLLTAPTAAAMKSDLHQYIRARYEFVAADAKVSQRVNASLRTKALQRHMWSLATTADKRNPLATPPALVIQALNNMIDVEAEQESAYSAPIPPAVFYILIIVVLVAAGMLGFGFGLAGRRATLPLVMFAVMLALVMSTIIDLDRPQRGLIRTDLTPLRSMLR